MVAPVWFKPLVAGQSAAFNVPWQMSSNAGASYAPVPTLPTAETIGPHGTQRFRLTVTIPFGAPNTLCVTVNGDIFAGGVLDPAEVVWDGLSRGFVMPMVGSNAGPTTFCLPATPGVHVFELWIGASTIGGLTNPNISADATDRMPCDCCPASETRCSIAPAAFRATLSGAVLSSGNTVATLNNFAGSGVNVVLSTGGTETFTDGGPATGLILGVGPPANQPVTFTFSAPVRLRHLGLADLDLASGGEFAHTFTVPFTDVDGTLVVSGSCAPGSAPCVRGSVNNSGGLIYFGEAVTGSLGFTLTRPAGLGQFLNDLAFDLTAAAIGPVFSCRRPSGALEWYSATGTIVPTADVVPCP